MPIFMLPPSFQAGQTIPYIAADIISAICRMAAVDLSCARLSLCCLLHILMQQCAFRLLVSAGYALS